jgi:hypothetical protein
MSRVMVPTCWILIRDGVAAAKERGDEVVTFGDEVETFAYQDV